MSEFLDNLEPSIARIHKSHDIDNAKVIKEISDAVKEAVTPLNTQIATLQSQVADLQKAAQDTVAALISGDTKTAEATASAAAGVSGSLDGGDAQEAKKTDDQAVS